MADRIFIQADKQRPSEYLLLNNRFSMKFPADWDIRSTIALRDLLRMGLSTI